MVSHQNVVILFLVLYLMEVSNVRSLEVHRTISQGTYRGMRKTVGSTEVDVFLGIRYGEAPTGDRRYKESSFPKDSNELHNATDLPSSCPQQLDNTYGPEFKGSQEWNPKGRIEEDCLFLNIWQPADRNRNPDKKRPVIVWIYGGGFTTGSSTLKMYDGTYLAARTNAVFVSFQYRVGALGFLYTGDDFAPGNAGLKDQVLALKWVNKHIETFGGDTDKVTIIGESAGSGSVGFHLISPETSKLFKRAVLLSGTPNAEWATLSQREAKQNAIFLADRLGADKSNDNNIKENLIRRDWREIVRNQGSYFPDNIFIQIPFPPTRYTALIPEHPVQMLEKATHLNGKEVILSWTKDEGTYFLIYRLNIYGLTRNPGDHPHIESKHFRDFMSLIAKQDQNDTEELVRLYGGKSNPLMAISDAVGDYYFKCPINKFVEELRKHNATVYQMEYDHRSNANPWPKWAGVMHSYDLEMLFGLPNQENTAEEYGSVDRAVSMKFVNHITNFVLDGNPSSTSPQKAWTKDQLYVLRNQGGSPDDRNHYCKKLDEYVDGYLDGAIRLRCDMLTMFIILITLKVLFLLQ